MIQTKGQLQDIISKEITGFYTKAIGTGPRESKAYILKDMIIVRLKGKLLPVEQRLLEGVNGVALIKDLRKNLHEVTTEGMNTIIKNITGQNVVSTHSDISTKTGELMKVFIVDTDLEAQLSR